MTASLAERTKKLGQILIERGWITPEQLQRALQNQAVVGARIGTCLLEMDALSEDRLLKALADQRGVPGAGVEDLEHIPAEVYAQVPARVARRCRAVPFRVDSNQVCVALLDARDLAIQDELAFVTAKRLKVHVANEARIYRALERGYGDPTPSRFQHLLERLNRARAAGSPPPPEPDAPPPPPADDLLVWSPPGGAAGDRESLRLPLIDDPTPPAATRASGASARAPERVLTSPALSPQAAEEPRPASQPALGSPPARASFTIPLAPEERARLGSPSGRPLALAEVEARLLDPRDRDDVARTLVAYLAQTFSRVALLMVRRENLSGWMGRGADLSEEQLRRFTVSLNQPSVFTNLGRGGALYLGPLAPIPLHRDLARAWGGSLPPECVLVPVRLRGRLVTVVYADRGEAGLATIDTEALAHLAAKTAAAFEICIQRAKGRRR